MEQIWRMSKWLGIEFALGSAMAIALYILDKSGKTSWPLNVGLLVLMTGLMLHPALSIPWVWEPLDLAMKIWRVCLVTCAVVLGVSWFAIWTWPTSSQQIQKDTPPTSDFTAGILNYGYDQEIKELF